MVLKLWFFVSLINSNFFVFVLRLDSLNESFKLEMIFVWI